MMMPRAVWSVVYAGVAVAGWLGAAGPVSALSVSYDQKATTKGMVISSTVLLKDGHFRAESIVDGVKAVVIRNQDGIFQYVPNQGMAMKLSQFDGMFPAELSGDYQEYLTKNQANQIGTETINGYPCEIMEFTDPAVGHTTAWVWTGHGFPVKVVQQGAQGETLIELSNIQLNAPIPDASFQLPPGVQVMEMGGLPSMGGATPGSAGGQAMMDDMMKMLQRGEGSDEPQ